MTLYAQTDGKQHSTNSGSWQAIPGLSFSIPEGVDTMAIITLNVPNPYAQGNQNPGGVFGISINGTMSPVVGVFTYNEANPPSTGRVPVTVVVGVPLGNKAQAIQAMWQNVRGSNVIIDSPATLSAILA